MQELSNFEKECVSLSHVHIEKATMHFVQGNYSEALSSVADARYNINLFVSAIRQKQHAKKDCGVCHG